MELARYRPVLTKNRGFFPDAQGRLPYSWCENCGSEVFEPGRLLCRRCVRRNEYGTMDGKTLYRLRPGGEPRAV